MVAGEMNFAPTRMMGTFEDVGGGERLRPRLVVAAVASAVMGLRIWLGLFGGSQGRGDDVGASGELLVEHIFAHAVVADKAKFVDEFLSVVFFFDLLVDKPCEAVACSVVVLRFGD
jgi:hypothetical protein